MTLLSKLKLIFKNGPIGYLASRYATYFIQFINSLFIAVYLGPYYLGIWGFIVLVIDYISQLNLGIQHSVNVIISINKEKEEYVQKIIGNGISMFIGLSFMVILFFVVNAVTGLKIGEKYSMSSYVIPICLIGILTHFNGIFSNVFRVYGKLFAIALNQSLYPLLILFLIPFFREQNLLWAMVFANCAAVTVCFVLFIATTPVKFKPLFNLRLMKKIQIKGWHLFIYNTATYFILLTTRTFISDNYSVKQFGYFSFSFALANAILLLFRSVQYLITPKLLNRFATSTTEHILSILDWLRTAYITFPHVVVHLAIAVFPLFLRFFPQYQPASTVFKLIALTVVVSVNASGYIDLNTARGKEKQLGKVAFAVLLLNISLSALFILWLSIHFDWAIVSTLLSYVVYVYVMGYLGRKELGLPTSFFKVAADIFPVKMLVPFVCSLLLIAFSAQDIYFVIPLILSLFMNREEIRRIKGIAKEMIHNPNFINI